MPSPLRIAFETTEEDVLAVLARHGAEGKADLEETVETVLAEGDRIAAAALYYCTLDEQTQAALAEIEDILIEESILPEDAEKVFFAP